MSAFEGKTAVITGGGTGVGAAIAVALADAKASIHLIGRRLDRLEAVAAMARKLGAQAACYSIDLATESGQIEVTRKLQRDLSSVDILVQNAATFMSGPIEQAKLEDFDALYRTNVRAAFALTQALFPMLKARRGQIVFMNSSSGIIAKPNSA